jgi:hypothetical protein
MKQLEFYNETITVKGIINFDKSEIEEKEEKRITNGKRGRTVMDQKMISYSTVIYEYNDNKSQDLSYDIIKSMIDINSEYKGDILSCFQIVQFLLKDINSEKSNLNNRFELIKGITKFN